MGIAQKVSRDFSDAVRSRGQSYFAKGRVAITSTSASEVVARVRGTAKYRVRLRLRGGRLHASCSCPYFGPFGDPCKHLWATVLAADARRLLQVQLEDAAAANDLFTTLMGDDVEPRREFIEKHALEVKNLDV